MAEADYNEEQYDEGHYADEEEFDPTRGYDPSQKYTRWELDQLATEFLRKDTRRELCRECESYGEETGEFKDEPQFEEDGSPKLDSQGKQLYVKFPELKCESGHSWYLGEGKARGISGDNPILFEEHLQSRKRREIHTSIGTPDPSIVQGMYNRTHPQGRKVNSKEQRKRNGASFFR